MRGEFRNLEAVLAARMRNQRLTATSLRRPADVVRWLGAVQAQEYAISRWAIGQRAGGVTDADVETAIDRGVILRTHVLRPTWHFVTPDDIEWMLALSAPRVKRIMDPYDRRLELDAKLFTRTNDAIARAVEGGRYHTRAELAEVLSRIGIEARSQRLAHIVMRAELDGIVCSGPRRGNQFTYALLAERASKTRKLNRDEALAELACRYFTSHGPATLRDFAWWSGQTIGAAREGVASATPALAHETVDGLTFWYAPPRETPPPTRNTAHLLPPYDEYLVAYKDRMYVAPEFSSRELTTEDKFSFFLVVAGRMTGVWRRVADDTQVSVDVASFAPLTRRHTSAVRAAARRFGEFLGVPSKIVVSERLARARGRKTGSKKKP